MLGLECPLSPRDIPAGPMCHLGKSIQRASPLWILEEPCHMSLLDDPDPVLLYPYRPLSSTMGQLFEVSFAWTVHCLLLPLVNTTTIPDCILWSLTQSRDLTSQPFVFPPLRASAIGYFPSGQRNPYLELSSHPFLLTPIPILGNHIDHSNLTHHCPKLYNAITTKWLPDL